MKSGNDPARAEIRPDPRSRFEIRILRQQSRTVVRVGVFQKLADDCAFVERFVVVLECWHQAARVEFQEGVGFVVRVHFNVLVGNFLLFQDGPGALNEGAACGMVRVGDFLGYWQDALTTSRCRV